ncbi:V-type proton ATPase subunit a [Entamoeba marina]
MGELLRSKEMALGQLIIPLDVVVETMHIVGELGTIQFNDMNSNKQSFERRFVREIQRCDELQRILSLFKETIKYEEQREGFNKLFYQPQIINPIESSTEQLELTLTRFAEDLQQTTNSTEIAEMSLKNSKEIIDISRHLGFLLEEINEIELSSLKYLIGAIESDRFESLRVLLWRISRGFMLLRSTAIEQSKTCFVVFIQGEEVYNKIKMVCKSINARVLEDVPLDRSQRQSYFKEQFDNLELYANAFEQALESKRQCLKLIAEKN